MSKKQDKNSTPSLFSELPLVRRRSPRNRKKLGIPAGLDLDKYELDSDSRLREVVGPWVRDKHAVLREYVGRTRGVRKKWIAKGPAGPTYIDLFSGPGRVKIRDTTEVLDGSPLVVWNNRSFGEFTNIYVADLPPDLVRHCSERLAAASAPVEHFVGAAESTVESVIARLDKRSYHFAFLDPFNLTSLSFEIIRKLAGLWSIDILMHVSAQDLNRNLRPYMEKEGSALDKFAPGWRKVVSNNDNDSDEDIREAIFEHWKTLLRGLKNMKVAEAAQLISGQQDQPLYWLAFASRHPLAREIWAAIQPPPPPEQGSLLT